MDNRLTLKMKKLKYKNIKSEDGFTLIELLIVIVIIAILATVVFSVLNPLARFQDSRSAVRSEEAYMIANAIKLDQLDHNGYYLDAINNLASGTVYMITDGVVSSGCDAGNSYCLTPVSSGSSCVDLSPLVGRGYFGDLPISQNGEGIWTTSLTGYTLEKNGNGIIRVRACEAENGREVEVAR